MIIHVAPHAAWWVRAAAAMALTLHIGGGCIGLVSGAISMSVRKGAWLHRTAGNVFVVSMLVMGTLAAVTAPLVPERGNIVGGVFTVYLVLTAWATMRRPVNTAGWFEAGAGVAALCIAAGAYWVGWLGTHSPNGLLDGQPTQSAYVLAGVALLAAALDLRMAWRGGLPATPRLVRHIWRMCTALFMASGSFFLGQQQVFPAMVQGSPLLLAPVLAPLMMMIFWQFRVRMTRPFAMTVASLDRG